MTKRTSIHSGKRVHERSLFFFSRNLRTGGGGDGRPSHTKSQGFGSSFLCLSGFDIISRYGFLISKCRSRWYSPESLQINDL